LIIVTEEAKALLGTIEHPEGTVLRLDPVAHDQATEQITLAFAPGEPHGDDQIVEQEGEEVLRIAAPVLIHRSAWKGFSPKFTSHARATAGSQPPGSLRWPPRG
jgi:hypothetical protein